MLVLKLSISGDLIDIVSGTSGNGSENGPNLNESKGSIANLKKGFFIYKKKKKENSFSSFISHDFVNRFFI